MPEVEPEPPRCNEALSRLSFIPKVMLDSLESNRRPLA